MLACLFCLCPPQSSALDGAVPETVKVGVLNNTTYADQDENGVWRGIDVECMIAVAQKAGFRLEFIDSSSDPDFLGSLDRGTYDIVADVVQTPARAENYLFTDEAMGITNNTLAVRADDDRWDYGNIEQITSMRVGVVASYASNADFRAYCVKHGISPVVVEFEDAAAMNAALQNSEIDGEVYSAIYGEAHSQQFRSILKFLPESYYFAFRKNDTALKTAVDDALGQILAGDVNYLIELKNRYETQYSSNILPFSAAEKQYIAAHPAVSVAVVENDEPYYHRSAAGADEGILPDYYALLAQQTGFAFRYQTYATHAQAAQAVLSGEADVLGLFGDGIIAAYRDSLALTDSYASVTNLLLTRQGTGLTQISAVAVPRCVIDSLQPGILKTFPHARVQGCENAQACLDTLVRGKADAVLIGLPGATWLINQTDASGYSIIAMPGVTTDLCAAVGSDRQMLCSILNKAIAATKDSFTGIVTSNTLPGNDWKTTFTRIPRTLLGGVACALLALVVCLVWALFQLRRRQKERAAVLAAQAETSLQKVQVEALRQSAEERNRFFANISHDMRTPLNAITGFIRLARRDGLPAQQRDDYLAKAESSSGLLLDLINDTLTMSKLNSGRMELHLQPCRLGEILDTVAAPIRSAAQKSGVSFLVDKTQVADTLLCADRLNLEKILLNLLTNAVKYTPAGGHVWLDAAAQPAGAQIRCTLIVRDDGIGVSEAFLPHIFEPFSQEKRHGYETVGTGLGLSIVRQLVELMGGTIAVESRQNAGTAFTVRLLFDPAAPSAPAPAPAAPAGEVVLRGRHVLLCEDNALNREIALVLLQDMGISADCAVNGKEGVGLFAQSAAGCYDAVLMDLRMPVMDGLAAAQAIRALPRPDAQDVPILAMTADAFADDVQKCLAAGMNGHVAKPIDPEVLTRTLTAALAGRAAHSEEKDG